jgi:tetratricopeptide (TPR) repeat protein
MKLLALLIMLLNFINVSAQSKVDFYNKAIELYDKEDYKNAMTQIDLALKQDPDNTDYLLVKGNVYQHLEKYQSAFDAYTKIPQLSPDDVSALNQRGLLLNKIQEFQSAIKDFNQALSLKNKDSFKLSLYINRGATKINLRDFQGAYDDFTSAYKIDSLDIGTLNNLASVCDEVGKGDKTLEYLYKIIKIDSTFIGAYGNIGFKYQEMGDYKTAIQFFDKVHSLAPEEPLAFSNRAFNKYKLGDLDGALIDINQSIVFYKTNSFAFRIRALIYLSQHKNNEACKDLDEAIRLGFTTMYGDEVQDLKIKYCK